MPNSKRYDSEDLDLLIGENISTQKATISPGSITLQELGERLVQKDFDKLIEGTHTASLGKIDRKIGRLNHYSFDFFFYTVGCPNSFDEEERIAHWLSNNFPGNPHELQLFTIDLIKAWVTHKDCVIRIAHFFLSNSGEEKLREELEAGLINNMERDLIWAEGKLWRNLWDLISVRWDAIAEGLALYYNCSFTEPEQLFKEIIGIDLKNQFDKFLQSRCVINSKEVKKLHVLKRKSRKGFGKLKDSEKKYLQSHKDSRTIKNPWCENLMELLSYLAHLNDDPILIAHAQIHNKWVDTIDKLYAKACSDPNNQEIYNSTWIDGKSYQGIVFKTARGNLKKARRNKSLQ